jgi:GH18 family chitinase
MMWQWILEGRGVRLSDPLHRPNLPQLNVAAITRFVKDWGLDGVDIDFEAEAGETGAAEGAMPGISSTALPTCSRFLGNGANLGPLSPPHSGCVKGTDGKIKCHSDADYISAIQRLRTALPRPYILTTAAWSIGAYGEG